MGEEGSSSLDHGPPELARLPSGRHGLPAEFINRNHRERLVAATTIAVAERGYDATTVSEITSVAAVSRRTFYKHFAGKEECFLAAFDLAREQVLARLVAATDGAPDWPGRVRAGLVALIALADEQPELARVFLIAPVAAGGEIAAHYAAALEEIVLFFREGRPERLAGRPVPDTSEQAVVGGIASFLAARIDAGELIDLDPLVTDLLVYALTPYLGSAEAKREAARLRR